jgi:hypothetical protein
LQNHPDLLVVFLLLTLFLGERNMKQTDRFLWGIVVGSVLLAAASFIMVLRLPQPTYIEDATPEGVVHNYLLALKRKDYGRAYQYLDNSLPGYPNSPEEFHQDVTRSQWNFSAVYENNVSLDIHSIEEQGMFAVVKVRESRFYDRGLFSSEQVTSNFNVNLINTNSNWKITSADSYWYRCWHSNSACP